MSFEKIANEKKKKEVVNKYLKNREILKQKLMNEKIGKQEFQRDIAEEVFKPVTTSITEAQKKTDEKQTQQIEQQGQLIRKIEEGQRKMVDAIRDIPSADSDVKYLFEEPKAIGAPKPKVGDLNAGLDIAELQKVGYKSPSELIGSSIEELHNLRTKLKQDMQKFNG